MQCYPAPSELRVATTSKSERENNALARVSIRSLSPTTMATFAAPQILSSLYHNATAIANALLDSSKPVGPLYANVDFSTLNAFETAWTKWYLWFDNPVVATGVMAFLMHEVS